MKIKRNSFWLKFYRDFHGQVPTNVCQLLISNSLRIGGILLVLSPFIIGLYWIFGGIGGIFLVKTGYESSTYTGSFQSLIFIRDSFVGLLVFTVPIVTAFFGLIYLMKSVEKGLDKFSAWQEKHCEKIEIEEN